MALKLKDLKVVRNSVIKPRSLRSSSSNTPSHPYLHTLVPLTVFDLANYNCHIPILYAFKAPSPDNRTLEDALAWTLFHYPHLAGSFASDDDGWPCILLDDTGIRFIETHVPTTLADHLPFDSPDEVTSLIPLLPAARELLLVQVNRFTCGGLAIGVAFQHRVADGGAISAFLVAWGMMARGWEDLPSPPFHDRRAVLTPRNPPRIDYPHNQIEFKNKSLALLRKPLSDSELAASLAGLTVVGIRYSSEFIATLKAEAAHADPSRRCTTFQCILAHVWKKLTFVRGLSLNEYTTIRAAVDGRRRMRNPPVPQSYFGNAVLWAFPRVKAGELLCMSYGEVAGVIRRAVAKVDEAYFRSCIDFGELKLKSEDDEFVNSLPSAGDILCPDVEFNSWLGLQFTGVDFGGGLPCCFCTPFLPLEGLAILAPSCEDGGGAHLFIAVKKEQAPLFREIAYALE